jgi:hypothetical protein
MKALSKRYTFKAVTPARHRQVSGDAIATRIAGVYEQFLDA